jgi:hypothetical protein
MSQGGSAASELVVRAVDGMGSQMVDAMAGQQKILFWAQVDSKPIPEFCRDTMSQVTVKGALEWLKGVLESRQAVAGLSAAVKMLRDDPLHIAENADYDGLLSLEDDRHLVPALQQSLSADMVYEQLGRGESTSALQLLANIMKGAIRHSEKQGGMVAKVNSLMNDTPPIRTLEYLTAGFSSWKDTVVEVQYSTFVTVEVVTESSEQLLENTAV